jgi:hypothetical protein
MVNELMEKELGAKENSHSGKNRQGNKRILTGVMIYLRNQIAGRDVQSDASG